MARYRRANFVFSTELRPQDDTMRQAMTGIAFAAYFATNSMVTLAHGLTGVGASFTAACIIGSTILLGICGWRRGSTLTGADLAFVCFILSSALSFIVSGFAEFRDVGLFAVSAAAFLAARELPDIGPSRAFVVVLGLVLIVGAIATAEALIAQWGDPHGKPLVFGQFDHAPAQFAFLLGLIAIVTACSTLPLIPMLALIAGPAAIFAASQVRLMFVAILLSLFVIGLIAPRVSWRAGVVAAVLVAALSAGWISRATVTTQFMQYAADALRSRGGRSGPQWSGAEAAVDRLSVRAGQIRRPGVTQGCPQIDTFNSIAIRKHLYAEALALLPSAGLFGIGLDRFRANSCLVVDSPHNSVLQAAVELGWPAGIALVALIVIIMATLLTRARTDGDTRIALGLVIFVVVGAMGSGRISRDSALFAALGYGAAAASRALATSRANAKLIGAAGAQQVDSELVVEER
jgi:O-antigen ligase/polysaccharide polymerase Wzy-like membrane protein